MSLTVNATIKPLNPGSSEIQLHGWDGYLPVLQSIVDTAERINGGPLVSQIVNTRAEVVDIKVTLAGDQKFDVCADAALLSGLQGKICAVKDDLGRNFARVRCHRAVVSGVLGTSGAAAYRAEAVLSLEVQENPT